MGGEEKRKPGKEMERGFALFCFYISKKWVPAIAYAHPKTVEKIWGP